MAEEETKLGSEMDDEEMEEKIVVDGVETEDVEAEAIKEEEEEVTESMDAQPDKVPRLPQPKRTDRTLREFLPMMTDYAPIVRNWY